MEFLSDEWFVRAAEVLGASDEKAGAGARIQYQVDGAGGKIRWYQVVEDGITTSWRPGDAGDPHVEIRWSRDAAHAILGARLTGDEAVPATTIVDRRPDHTYVGPPPPLDVNDEPELARLRRLPGADLVLHYELRDAPFGDVTTSMIVADGRIAEHVVGRVGLPDVELATTYRQLMRLRQGGGSIEQVLEAGTITGSLDHMIFLAGLVESVPFQRASRHCSSGPASLALAALGEATARPAYREAMAVLMSETGQLQAATP